MVVGHAGRAAALVGALALLAGCSGGTKASDATGSFTAPDIPAQRSIGSGEGQVSIVAWAGYVEDGSTDPKADWVSQFTRDTGCKVNSKVAGTSDEMVSLMKTGAYDVVSASGDATLRLIAAGDVAPVNLDLTPSYKDVFDGLKNQPYNTVKGKSYGVPQGRGANVLMYRTDVVKPAPDSWGVMWQANSPYKGKMMGYDSPIYIADAALYLMKTKSELGITNPYALDDKQLAAAVSLLKQQKANIGEYWSDYLKEISAFKSGDSVLGTAWQVIANQAKEQGAPVQAVLPKEGATGWSDTWMISAKSTHPNCAYMWMNWAISPKTNAQIAEYFGEAPANRISCQQTSDPDFCATYHADDENYYRQIWLWTTPIPQCLDGRNDVKCTSYQQWTQKWTEIKG